MSQTTSDSAPHRKHSPIKDASTPQMRAVRKELLLLRADVERAEFAQARADLQHTFANFGWLKLLLPGFMGARSRGWGKGINASISDWVTHHPLVSSLGSLLLAKPLRSRLAAGAKPLFKWGVLGFAAWAGYRLWRQIAGDKRDRADADGGSAS